MIGMRISGLALLLALAACGESVTAPTMAPRFDGGHTLGGGFDAGAPPAEAEGSTTCEEDDRGGHTLGGGFRDAPCPEPVPAF